MRTARKGHPIRSALVCHTGLLRTTPHLEAKLRRNDATDGLFDRHGLSKIARLVYVGPQQRGAVIGQQL